MQLRYHILKTYTQIDNISDQQKVIQYQGYQNVGVFADSYNVMVAAKVGQKLKRNVTKKKMQDKWTVERYTKKMKIVIKKLDQNKLKMQKQKNHHQWKCWKILIKLEMIKHQDEVV